MKNFQNNRIRSLYIASVLLLLFAVIFGIFGGAVRIPLKALTAAGSDNSTASLILRYVRIPRVIACVLCGAALANSGAVIQGVLANRLASPSIIGVNAGAGLAVTLCSAVGVLGGWRTAFFAFAGSFVSVMLIGLGAKRWGASRGTVILLGVALNSLLGAVSDTVITFIPEVGVISRDFKVGDFSSVTYTELVPASIIILLTLAVLFTLADRLSVLTLGEDSARSLGMNTVLMRTVFLTVAALLAGAAVSIAGLLSFVGLLVPHAVRRLMGGGRGVHLYPLCSLFGGGFVLLCDTFARTVFAPYEIPVGIVMAFLGAPFFMFILINGRGESRND